MHNNTNQPLAIQALQRERSNQCFHCRTFATSARRSVTCWLLSLSFTCSTSDCSFDGRSTQACSNSATCNTNTEILLLNMALRRIFAYSPKQTQTHYSHDITMQHRIVATQQHCHRHTNTSSIHLYTHMHAHKQAKTHFNQRLIPRCFQLSDALVFLSTDTGTCSCNRGPCELHLTVQRDGFLQGERQRIQTTHTMSRPQKLIIGLSSIEYQRTTTTTK